jgi:hypothetical protein
MKGQLRRGYEDFRLRELLRLRFGFGGTFAPFFRASDSPMATACLRLVTFLPLLPLLSVPRLRRCMADSTDLCAFFPYLAIRSPPLRRQDTGVSRPVRIFPTGDAIACGADRPLSSLVEPLTRWAE